jgi:hypothetical protein
LDEAAAVWQRFKRAQWPQVFFSGEEIVAILGSGRIPAGKTNRHGTTNPRQVPPPHPEWVEELRLRQLWSKPLPGLSSQSQAGARVNQHLWRHSPRFRGQMSMRRAVHGAQRGGAPQGLAHQARHRFKAGRPAPIPTFQ